MKISIKFNLITIIKRSSFLLIIFIFLNTEVLYSQCSLGKVKDKFTSTQTVTSKEVKLVSVFPLIGNKKPWDITMHFMMSDDNCTISITHESQSYSTDFKSFYFKFNNGTVLKKDVPSGSGDFNTGFGYQLTFTLFSLTKDELIIFSKNEITDIQAVFSDFPDYPVVEKEVKKKSAERIMEDAICILKEMDQNISDKNKNKIEGKLDCKYTNDEIDGFTKKRFAQTNPEVLYLRETTKSIIGHFINVTGCFKDSTYCLNFNWGILRVSGGQKIEPRYFDQIDLLLENTEVVSLKNNELSTANTLVSCYLYSKMFPIKDLTIWEKLKLSPVKKIRISLANKELFTIDIEDKSSKSVVKVIGCIENLGIKVAK